MASTSIEKLNGFPHFRELHQEIASHGKVIRAEKGDVLIREGQYLDFMPIVISGMIRVFRENDDREILLYYVKPGETCMMSLSAAYFDYTSTANGVAMEPSEILVLPARIISEWQLKYPSWNKYILQTYKSRYDELLSLFGSLAFQPIPKRLHQYLMHKSKSNPRIDISHQVLANELGTTRVVVSRILKQFEKEKLLKLHRGYIMMQK